MKKSSNESTHITNIVLLEKADRSSDFLDEHNVHTSTVPLVRREENLPMEGHVAMYSVYAT